MRCGLTGILSRYDRARGCGAVRLASPVFALQGRLRRVGTLAMVSSLTGAKAGRLQNTTAGACFVRSLPCCDWADPFDRAQPNPGPEGPGAEFQAAAARIVQGQR